MVFQKIKEKIRLYWSLIKCLQTGLLLFTGLAGFMSARCPVMNWYIFLGLTLSLLLAISGSTILNMWYDRDIDSAMARTHNRPLAAGRISSKEALIFGLATSLIGVGLALVINITYGLIVCAGLFFDVVVYTIWLKRRTCWSIVWGGISGGMPILAGRTLGLGYVDGIGILLSLAILLWIPTHILTFSMRHAQDFQSAHIPTFPSVYGFKTTRTIIAVSSILAAISIGGAGLLIGLRWGVVRLLSFLSLGLFLIAILSILRPSDRVNFGLYKYASFYMLSSMALLSFGAI